jgi:hypothetical protein
MDKEEIKPIYRELKGLLSQVSDCSESSIDSPDDILRYYHSVIDELNQKSDKDYSRFRVIIQRNNFRQYIKTIDYKTKLAGLIARLQAEYFPEEPENFSQSPNTIINQQQNQFQSTTIMLLDFQSKIDEKIHKLEEGSKERTFLEKIKESLKTTTNITGLIINIFRIAKELGFSAEKISEIFT